MPADRAGRLLYNAFGRVYNETMTNGQALRHTRRKHAAGRKIRPERVLALGFLALILLGAAVLALPSAAATGQSIGAFSALFTAASAVCVTGLTVVDTASAFSTFGHAVLLVLIQAGGLSFMVLATLIMAAMGRRITLRGRLLIRESMNASSMAGIVRLAGAYSMTAVMMEMIGAALLAVRFVPQLGWRRGAWYAVFHAVSAFCNAGFDLFGASLTSYRDDWFVLTVIALLIILGGTGFAVMSEWRHVRRGWRALSLHARVVLVTSGMLLASGTLLYALLEWNNPGTLAVPGHDGMAEKLLNACFQSVTMRTAGFSTFSPADMRDASKLLSISLMFIGASPASTGGGIKTTTVSILFLILASVVRGNGDVQVFGRRLSHELMRRAVALMMVALLILLGAALAMTVIEREQIPFVDILFEAASALGTVGVSAAGTALMHPVSQAVLIPLMYFGRVGVLSLTMTLANRQQRAENRIRFPEDSIMIG